MPVKKSPTTHPDAGSPEQTEELIRQRAYGLYEERGCQHGYDVDDWLRAEAEVNGKMPDESQVEATAVAA